MKIPVLIFLIFLSLTAVSQDKPTIFLIGDSTMSDKEDPEINPEHGWGQMLPELLTNEVTIDNHAVNGRSTRNFISEGRWEKVKGQLKPGDYVFIQFGHNDQKVNDPERYTNPYTQYRYNLEKFVNETRQQGAKPVLFSSIVRRNFNEECVLLDTHGDYPLVVRMVARDLDVPFIDLQYLTERMEITAGPEESKDLHLHLKPGEDPYEPEGVEDNTHLSEKGATMVASLALNELLTQQHELGNFVRKEALVLPGPLVSNDSRKEEERLNWRQVQNQSKEWYGSEDAVRIADNVLLYQNKNGGWEKNIDMTKELSEAEKKQLAKETSSQQETGIDNRATFTQMRYLAKVYNATGKEAYKESFLDGLDFLLEAQYDSGGWPQFYPLKKGYYEHITFNDDAMIGVMELLRDVSRKAYPFDFVDPGRRQKAEEAIEKGLKIILNTQVEVDGQLTVWSAQHDVETLKPAKARAYELPSLSGKESVKIVKYLMDIENPSSEVKEAIRAAVAWFEKTKISGKKVIWKDDPSLPEGKDRIAIAEKDAGPLWARFYEIESFKPLFVGRDGIKQENFNDIEHERRINYSYMDNYAEELLEKAYPQWEAKF